MKEKYTLKKYENAPIGTKLNFENGYIIKVTDKRNYGYSNNIDYKSTLNNTICLLENNMKNSYFGKLISIEEPNYITIYEPEKEILDEVEKRYLRGVIRPFRDKVKAISLITSGGKSYCYINIELEDETIYLPDFEINTMYKGMKSEKEYTLEELGL